MSLAIDGNELHGLANAGNIFVNPNMIDPYFSDYDVETATAKNETGSFEIIINGFPEKFKDKKVILILSYARDPSSDSSNAVPAYDSYIGAMIMTKPFIFGKDLEVDTYTGDGKCSLAYLDNSIHVDNPKFHKESWEYFITALFVQVGGSHTPKSLIYSCFHYAGELVKIWD